MRQDGHMAPVTPPSWYASAPAQSTGAPCQISPTTTPVTYAVTPCHRAVPVTHQQVHSVRPVSSDVLLPLVHNFVSKCMARAVSCAVLIRGALRPSAGIIRSRGTHVPHTASTSITRRPRTRCLHHASPRHTSGTPNFTVPLRQCSAAELSSGCRGCTCCSTDRRRHSHQQAQAPKRVATGEACARPYI